MYLARSTLLSSTSSTRSSSTRLDLDSSRYLLGLIVILDLYRFSIIITHGHAWGTCVQKH